MLKYIDEIYVKLALLWNKFNIVEVHNGLLISAKKLLGRIWKEWTICTNKQNLSPQLERTS